MMRKRMVGAGALAGTLALVCSACGGGSPSAASRKHHHSTTHSTTTSTTTPPPTTSTSSTTSTSTTSSGGSGLALCTFADLSISVGQPAAGLGHEGGTLVFKNVGTVDCQLQGYPGVAALDSTAKQAEQAQRTPSGYLGGLVTGSRTPPKVELPPGAVASAMVEGTDVPTGTATSCPTYPALLVTPPTSAHSVRLTLSLPGCSPIQVHPVVSGTRGSTS